jgi:hypothetical protein
MMHCYGVPVDGYLFEIADVVHAVCAYHGRQMRVMQEKVVMQMMHAHIVQVSLSNQIFIDITILGLVFELQTYLINSCIFLNNPAKKYLYPY